MAHFNPGGGDSSTFGKNEYRRSTKGLKYDPGTLYMESVTEESTMDSQGVETMVRILQSGEALARITSGDGKDKFGPFQLAATDGRADVANLVGVNDTFLPWQLMRRDVEVGICYEGTLNQDRCFIRDADGKRIRMTDTVAAALVAKKSTTISFR